MSRSRLKFLVNNFVSIDQAREVHALILINHFNHLEPLFVHRILHSCRSYRRDVAWYAQKMLNRLQDPDAFSWGCLIRFSSKYGQFQEAFSLYSQMRRLGVVPSSHAMSSALRACARLEYETGGSAIHAQVQKLGFSRCVYVQTALVDLYSKLGDVKMANLVFDDIAEKSVVSWNSMLDGHLRSGDLVEARNFFDEMPSKDVISWNMMLSGYAKRGDIEQASILFQQMPETNPSSWNTMISGYMDCGNIASAQRLFDAMPQKSNVSWITMISGYSRCGDVLSARNLFEQMNHKDTPSYNAMIACYAQNSQPKEALGLFDAMLRSDVYILPDEVTLACAISACTQLGDLRSGAWIESLIPKLRIEMDDHMATALMDLYMKCGEFAKAFELFHKLRNKDVVAYSAMIMGCGINGKYDDAMKLFDAMQDAKIYPNLITFTGLLTACNHTGLVEEGYRCLDSMKDYGLETLVDHYGIMVDLLGRAGRLEEAYTLIKGMKIQPNAGVWGALLLACMVHGNVEIGEIAAQHCTELEPDPAGYLSLLANIYMSAARWEDARKLRKVMEKKFTKTIGCSWVASA